MARLRKLTLDFNERKDRWDLTDDKTDRVIKTFDTKGDATKGGVTEGERPVPGGTHLSLVEGPA